MKLKQIFIFITLINFEVALAQQVSIKGRVFDSQLNKSLSNATINVGKQYARTDIHGYFELIAALNTFKERGIEVSHVGYLKTRLIYEPNHFYEINLLQNTTQLREVVIGVNAEDIIKKAIRKIPTNYPDKPINILGILRTQHWRNNSSYFKSDAVIKAYIPQYASSEKTSVTVLKNRIDTIKDNTLKYIRTHQSYNIVDFVDLAHNKEVLGMLSKKRKFDYQLVGKQVYNNHKVFVINTTLSDTIRKFDKLQATFYIDTASYAFVAANLTYHNVKKVISNKILSHRVIYDKIDGKWYLNEARVVTTWDYKDQSPQSTVDFIRTELYTNNVERIPYKDIIQEVDDVFLIDRHTKEQEWLEYENIFKKAESEGKLEIISKTLLDTIKQNNLIANQNYKKPFGRKVYDYIRGDNIRSTFSVNKIPVSIVSSSYDIPEVITYGVGFGADYRLYKSLFFGFQLQYNVPNSNKLKVSTIGLNLSNEFVFNRNARNIVLAPYLGINWITTKQTNEKASYRMIDYGLRVSYELNHKNALFVASSFNSASGSKNINEYTLIPSPTSIGIGIVFKN